MASPGLLPSATPPPQAAIMQAVQSPTPLLPYKHPHCLGKLPPATRAYFLLSACLISPLLLPPCRQFTPSPSPPLCKQCESLNGTVMWAVSSPGLPLGQDLLEQWGQWQLGRSPRGPQANPSWARCDLQSISWTVSISKMEEMLQRHLINMEREKMPAEIQQLSNDSETSSVLEIFPQLTNRQYRWNRTFTKPKRWGNCTNMGGSDKHPLSMFRKSKGC